MFGIGRAHRARFQCGRRSIFESRLGLRVEFGWASGSVVVGFGSRGCGVHV